MDTMSLHGLEFYGYHGFLNEEQELGQRFIIDIDLHLDLQEAGQHDDLRKTVNYAEAYTIVKKLAEEQRFALLEALAENIASALLKQYAIVNSIDVKVKKPQAPIPGIFDYFSVSIHRQQNA